MSAVDQETARERITHHEKKKTNVETTAIEAAVRADGNEAVIDNLHGRMGIVGVASEIGIAEIGIIDTVTGTGADTETGTGIETDTGVRIKIATVTTRTAQDDK